MTPVRHHRHDRNTGTEGHTDESGPSTEVDRVAVEPGPAGLPVSPRVVEHQGTLGQGGLGLVAAGGYGPDTAEEPTHAGDGEEEVVSQRERRVGRSPALHDGQGGDPGVRHVEEAVVVPDQQRRPSGRDVFDAPDLGGEVPRVRPDGLDLALDVGRVPMGRVVTVLVLEAPLQPPERPRGATRGAATGAASLPSPPRSTLSMPTSSPPCLRSSARVPDPPRAIRPLRWHRRPGHRLEGAVAEGSRRCRTRSVAVE